MPLPNRRRDKGPVIDYLAWLTEQAKATRDEKILGHVRSAILAIQRIAETEDGAILLDLLKKSTLEFALPPSTDARALEAHNAQAFIFLDLARIASHELDGLYSIDLSEPRGRRRRSRASGGGSSAGT